MVDSSNYKGRDKVLDSKKLLQLDKEITRIQEDLGQLSKTIYTQEEHGKSSSLEALKALDRRKKQELTHLLVAKSHHESAVSKKKLFEQLNDKNKAIVTATEKRETHDENNSLETMADLRKRKKAIRSRKLGSVKKAVLNPIDTVLGGIGKGIGNLLNTKGSKQRKVSKITNIEEEIEYYQLKGDTKKVKKLLEKKRKEELHLNKKNSKGVLGTNQIRKGVTTLKTSKANFFGASLSKFTEELNTQLRNEKKVMDDAVSMYGYTKTLMKSTNTVDEIEMNKVRKSVHSAVTGYWKATNKIRKKYNFDVISLEEFVKNLKNEQVDEVFNASVDTSLSDVDTTKKESVSPMKESKRLDTPSVVTVNSEDSEEARRSFGVIGALGNSLGIKNSLTDEEFEAKDKTKMIKLTESIEKNLAYIADKMVDEQDTSIERKDYSKKSGTTTVVAGGKNEEEGSSILDLILMAAASMLTKIWTKLGKPLWDKFIKPMMGKMFAPFKKAMAVLKGLINKVTKKMFGKEMFNMDTDIDRDSRNDKRTTKDTKGRDDNKKSSRTSKRQSRKRKARRGNRGFRGMTGGCCMDLASDFDNDRKLRDKNDKLRDKKTTRLEKVEMHNKSKLNKMGDGVKKMGSKLTPEVIKNPNSTFNKMKNGTVDKTKKVGGKISNKLGQVGDKAKNLVSKVPGSNVGGKIAKKAMMKGTKVIPVLGGIIAVGGALLDGRDEATTKNLGLKEGADITLGDRALSMAGGFLGGLSFGDHDGRDGVNAIQGAGILLGLNEVPELNLGGGVVDLLQDTKMTKYMGRYVTKTEITKMNEAFEKRGLIDIDGMGDSEIVDMDGIKKLTPNEILAIRRLNDWDAEDAQALSLAFHTSFSKNLKESFVEKQNTSNASTVAQTASMTKVKSKNGAYTKEGDKNTTKEQDNTKVLVKQVASKVMKTNEPKKSGDTTNEEKQMNKDFDSLTKAIKTSPSKSMKPNTKKTNKELKETEAKLERAINNIQNSSSQTNINVGGNDTKKVTHNNIPSIADDKLNKAGNEL